MDVINDAWSNNWGFVPITHAEMHEIATMVRLALRPQDIAIAEYKGEPAAFAMVIPDFNEAIRDLGGRLFPLGLAKFLWRLKVTGTRRTRMPFMGVRQKYQSSSLGAAMALAVIAAARDFNVKMGAEYGELSWVLEQNEQVRKIISLVGAKEHKRYRIYGKELT
jgi:GNAT superfamily N-acetyltransferase